MFSIIGAGVIAESLLVLCAAFEPPTQAPPGMVWVPGGEFTMGTDDPSALPNERPAHRVKVSGFWMDETPITNAQFRAFVQATGYVTTAERPVDWEELKKQVPPGTPKPPDDALRPGSLLYTRSKLPGEQKLSLSANHAWAQDDPPAADEPAPGSSDQDLAKQLANPVADLISVPLQFNYDTGFDGPGGAEGDRFTLNVQPVIPFGLNQDWNLITRTILPVIYQDDVLIDANSTQFGLGDTVQSFFFSPKQPGPAGAIWGVGPAFLWPTATNDSLGSEQWGFGPTGVVLIQEGPWTYGALANHIWSYAGDDERADVNVTFLQPFLNYTTTSATTFFLNTEATYDWTAEQWSVPVNFGANQLLKLGEQPVQIGGGVRWYADAPDGGPEWGIRFNVVLLFPK